MKQNREEKMNKKRKILIIILILLIVLFLIILLYLKNMSKPVEIYRLYLVAIKSDNNELRKASDDDFFEKYNVNIYYKRN